MDEMRDTVAGEQADAMLKFAIRNTPSSGNGARLGQLNLRTRPITIDTPHYIVPTSRGVVPHLSQDNLQKHTSISAVYVPLEDFIEKSHTDAPIYSTPVQDGESPLRQYIGLPDRCLSILGPRRMPGVTPPAHNTNSSVAISTSVGFRQLELQHYNVAIKRLKADISASLADVVTAEHAGAKRIARSADRTHAWLRDSLEEVTRGKQAAPLPFFASIPPLEPSSLLALYLSDLHYEYKPHTSGLCLYSAATAEAIPKALRELPSICLVDPPTPQALLATIHAGLDLVTVPFVTQASEAGIALSFSFPHSTADSTTRATKPLGFDLWSTTHASDLSPLGADCQCYTCRRHHRAYVHHLLQANEMLAWTLLQIHNYTVIDAFFHGVRRSLEQGTFEYDMETFGRAYESEMPAKTGQGPRVRGYQTKSGRGEPKKNAKAYGRLDDQMQKLAEAESGVATPDGDADDIEAHGLASKVDDINITR